MMINYTEGARRSHKKKLDSTAARTMVEIDAKHPFVTLESLAVSCRTTATKFDFYIENEEGEKYYLIEDLEIDPDDPPYVFKDHCIPLKKGEAFKVKAAVEDRIDVTMVVITSFPVQVAPFQQTAYPPQTGGLAIAPPGGRPIA